MPKTPAPAPEPRYRALVGITIDPVDEGEAFMRFEEDDIVAGLHPLDLEILLQQGAVELIADDPAPSSAATDAHAPQEPAGEANPAAPSPTTGDATQPATEAHTDNLTERLEAAVKGGD